MGKFLMLGMLAVSACAIGADGPAQRSADTEISPYDFGENFATVGRTSLSKSS